MLESCARCFDLELTQTAVMEGPIESCKLREESVLPKERDIEQDKHCTSLPFTPWLLKFMYLPFYLIFLRT